MASEGWDFWIIKLYWLCDLYWLHKDKTKYTSRKGIKSKETLEIIYTDIYGPSFLYLICEKYFIIFIDGHSWCMYMCLLFDKANVLIPLKNSK